MGQSSSGTLQIAEQRYETTLPIIRPSNTTGYTALDVIGVADANVAANAGSAILSFVTIGPVGGIVRILAADLLINLAAVTAGMTTFRLHLYNAAPTAILDNAGYDLVAGDRAAYLGYIDIAAPTDLGSTLYSQVINGTTLPHVKLAAGSSTLYGILQTIGAFTPTSGETYQVRLRTSEA
jgi:hypothetical protein